MAPKDQAKLAQYLKRRKLHDTDWNKAAKLFPGKAPIAVRFEWIDRLEMKGASLPFVVISFESSGGK